MAISLTKRKTFTLRDVAEALINDTSPKAKGTYFKAGPAKSREALDEGHVKTADTGGYVYSNSEVGASCAIGGAALVLGVSAGDLEAALGSIMCDLGLPKKSKVLKEVSYMDYNTRERVTPAIHAVIIGLNDGTTMSKAAIGQRILDYCEPFLDVQMTAYEANYRIAAAIKAA